MPSPEYMTWTNMKQRCFNPNHPRYKGYGGRGITVCARWLVFKNFIEDMGPRPPDKTSLDRINNDGNYEPGNCRWATIEEQVQTRRKPRGGTHCKRGHEFTPENTYWSKGTRRCRTCRLDWDERKKDL